MPHCGRSSAPESTGLAQAHIAAAQRAIPTFGVATECCFGRRPPETVPDLLRLHAAVGAP